MPPAIAFDPFQLDGRLNPSPQPYRHRLGSTIFRVAKAYERVQAEVGIRKLPRRSTRFGRVALAYGTAV